MPVELDFSASQRCSHVSHTHSRVARGQSSPATPSRRHKYLLQYHISPEYPQVQVLWMRPSYICKWLGVCKHAHIDNDCQPSDIIDFWCNEINRTNNRSVTHSWQHESKSPTVSQRFFKCFFKMWGIWVDSPSICSVPLLLHIVFQGCSYQLSSSCAWHTMPWG